MTSTVAVTDHETDILIIGAGGAGLLAALHAHRRAPELRITVAVKGLIGKSGCTRMVQGGYNVALNPGDSVERHFMDTIEGGKWLPNQELAWRLVTGAVDRIHELEHRYGCYFDRNPDGTLHQKAFAGQSFDRTAHKGDLTGIEIMGRLMEHALSVPLERLEEHRALSLLQAADGSGIAGALLLDMRTGAFRRVRAHATLLAAGGGPSMYRYHTPSGDKSCDGHAMALRAGVPLRDMEMVQFHPTGVLAGTDTRLTGTIIEEGLRGAGGYLINGAGERFMFNYHPHGERATRDVVSRGMYMELMDGRGTPDGGLLIRMGHLGGDQVRRQFKGMVKRCADIGYDLAEGDVPVLPTAHYMMGGVVFDTECRTPLHGLYVAGEDSGGIHGANRLGGNGVANSTVFGGIAGDTMARDLLRARAGNTGVGATSAPPPIQHDDTDAVIAATVAPFTQPTGDLNALRNALQTTMWEDVGIVRTANGLARARTRLAEIKAEHAACGIADARRAFNLTWQDWLNLENQILASEAITEAAIARTDSRGAHYRSEHPDAGDLASTTYTEVSSTDGTLTVSHRPVSFSVVAPGESLIDEDLAPPTVYAAE